MMKKQTRPYYNIDFTYEIIDQTPIKTEQDLINEKYIKIRIKRNHLLQETDHIMMPDYPMVDKSARTISPRTKRFTVKYN